MTQISLVASKRSYQGIQAVLEPLEKELGERLKNLDRLVVKINFVSTHIKLATTPFETVRAFIDFVKPIFGGKIMIVEEAMLGDTQVGFERYGFKKIS